MLVLPVPQISSREPRRTWPRLRAAWTWTSWWGCWWPGRLSGKRPGKRSASRAAVYCSCCWANACLQRDLQWIRNITQLQGKQHTIDWLLYSETETLFALKSDLIQLNSVDVKCAILFYSTWSMVRSRYISVWRSSDFCPMILGCLWECSIIRSYRPLIIRPWTIWVIHIPQSRHGFMWMLFQHIFLLLSVTGRWRAPRGRWSVTRTWRSCWTAATWWVSPL